MIAHPATYEQYIGALATARLQSERIREATSPAHEMPESAFYLLTNDGLSGYGVTVDDELIGLFSLVPGRGTDLVNDAIKMDGVTSLDCFDGFLPSFYERFGFKEYKREANWTEGGPDVVFMKL